MKATVVEIQSKSYRIMTSPRPYRLIALQFDLGLARGGTEIVRLPEDCLGVTGLELDDEVEVSFTINEPDFTLEQINEEAERLIPPTLRKKEEKW